MDKKPPHIEAGCSLETDDFASGKLLGTSLLPMLLGIFLVGLYLHQFYWMESTDYEKVIVSAPALAMYEFCVCLLLFVPSESLFCYLFPYRLSRVVRRRYSICFLSALSVATYQRSYLEGGSKTFFCITRVSDHSLELRDLPVGDGKRQKGVFLVRKSRPLPFVEKERVLTWNLTTACPLPVTIPEGMKVDCNGLWSALIGGKIFVAGYGDGLTLLVRNIETGEDYLSHRARASSKKLAAFLNERLRSAQE